MSFVPWNYQEPSPVIDGINGLLYRCQGLPWPSSSPPVNQAIVCLPGFPQVLHRRVTPII